MRVICQMKTFQTSRPLGKLPKGAGVMEAPCPCCAATTGRRALAAPHLTPPNTLRSKGQLENPRGVAGLPSTTLLEAAESEREAGNSGARPFSAL